MARSVDRVRRPGRGRAAGGAFCLALLLAGPLAAGEVIVRPEAAAPLEVDTIAIRAVAVDPEPEGGDRSGGTEMVAEISLGAAHVFELTQDRFWEIEVASEAVWAPVLVVDPRSEAGPVPIPIFPARRLHFPVETQGLTSTPDELVARFEMEGRVGGVVDCPVVEGVATCELPAVELDLRLSARTFAPVYRLGLDVARAGRPEAVQLVSGPSVRGRVVLDDGRTPAPAGTEVVLAPDGEMDPRTDRRLSLLVSRTGTDEDGYFQFAGVHPGLYRVTVEAEGYAPVSVASVEARPDLEASLLAPLVLTPPVTFAIDLVPEVDPWGERWAIRLTRTGPDEGTLDSLEIDADDAGHALREDVPPGRYRLSVEGSEGTVWLQLPVELTAGAEPLFVEIPLVEVIGTLDFGDGPVIPGELWFGGRNGARRVVVAVDEEGALAGFLPEAGEWPVEWVPADERDSDIVLPPVEVPDRRRAKLDLRLPAGRIAGEVVDERGSPVAGARVDLIHMDRKGRGGLTVTDEDGTFTLRWLDPGTYAVAAREGEATSEAVEVRLREDLDPPPLRLTVRELATLTGRLHVRDRPVAGGRVLAWADLGSGPAVSSREAFSGPDGLFSLEIPRDLAGLNFLIDAPGHAIRLGRIPLQPGSIEGTLQEIELDAQGGILRVQEPEALAGGVFLVHDGSFMLLEAVHRVAAPRGDPSGGAPVSGDVVIPGLEPGLYAVCPVAGALAALRTGAEPPAEACASGVLGPLGELRLGLPYQATR